MLNGNGPAGHGAVQLFVSTAVRSPAKSVDATPSAAAGASVGAALLVGGAASASTIPEPRKLCRTTMRVETQWCHAVPRAVEEGNP
jgi:hypothetical protein